MKQNLGLETRRSRSLLIAILYLCSLPCLFGSSTTNETSLCDGLRTPQDLSRHLWGAESGYQKQTRPGFFKWSNENIFSGGSPPPPDTVGIQIKIDGVKGVDVSTNTFQIYCWLRRKWNDPRLAYSTQSQGGCMPDAVRQGFQIQELNKLWLPDIFILNLDNMQVLHEGLWIYPNGDVSYVSSLILRLSCNMNIKKFPVDVSECHLRVGTFLEDATGVILEKFNPGNQSAIEQTCQMENVEWIVFASVEQNELSSYGATQAESELQFNFKLARIPSHYWMFFILPAVLLVTIGWFTFFVARSSVPARAGMSMICFLTMSNFLSNSVRGLPKEGYDVFLLRFLMVSTFFTFLTIAEYVACNFLVRVEGRVKKAQAALCEQIEDELDIKEPADKPARATKSSIIASGYNNKADLLLVKADGTMLLKGNHLDIFCRYVYPIVYVITTAVLWTNKEYGISSYVADRAGAPAKCMSSK